MLSNGIIDKKFRPFLRLDLKNRKKSRAGETYAIERSLALTHRVGTPKIGEHLLSQDIHSVLHSGGVKIKISGNADPTPSI